MSNEVKYCGNGRVLTTKYGDLIKLGMNTDDLKLLTENLNDKGWVNVLVKKKKNPMEGKPELYLVIDDYVKADNNEAPPEVIDNQPPPEDDDLPF